MAKDGIVAKEDTVSFYGGNEQAFQISQLFFLILSNFLDLQTTRMNIDVSHVKIQIFSSYLVKNDYITSKVIWLEKYI